MADTGAILKARWLELCPAGVACSETFSELLAAYGSRARAYHNTGHIAALLQLSAAHAADLTDHDAVDLAIFYHDAVYDPSRPDNELRSAEFARERLPALGVLAERIDWIARAIEATKHSAASPTGDRDLDHLLDFDLSILAADPATYDAYAQAIRQEYAIYPDAIYRSGRAKVLTAFLDAAAIYRVPKLAETWDSLARCNLAAELAGLV